MINREVKRVVRLQVMLTLAAVLVGAVIGGFSPILPISVMIGGLCVIIPALLYGKIAYARRHEPPVVLMRAHFKAEAVKFVTTLLMFGAALVFFKDLSVVGMFGGYMTATSGYWFGLLIKN